MGLAFSHELHANLWVVLMVRTSARAGPERWEDLGWTAPATLCWLICFLDGASTYLRASRLPVIPAGRKGKLQSAQQMNVGNRVITGKILNGLLDCSPVITNRLGVTSAEMAFKYPNLRQP